MKKIGIIGGTTPESTVEYYRYYTRHYFERFGDHNYPEVIIYSVSFQRYMDWMANDQWEELADGLIQAAQSLQAAGADLLLLATNTMHRVIDRVQPTVDIPMVNLLDAVAQAIKDRGQSCVGLLGTRVTMESAFYRQALAERDITVLVPEQEDRDLVDRVIMQELSIGQLRPESRARYLEIMQELAGRGAEGIILGCTEIPLLVRPQDTALPLYDTTTIHAEAGLQLAMDSAA